MVRMSPIRVSRHISPRNVVAESVFFRKGPDPDSISAHSLQVRARCRPVPANIPIGEMFGPGSGIGPVAVGHSLRPLLNLVTILGARGRDPHQSLTIESEPVVAVIVDRSGDSILGHGASTSLDKSESVEVPSVSTLC